MRASTMISSSIFNTPEEIPHGSSPVSSPADEYSSTTPLSTLNVDLKIACSPFVEVNQILLDILSTNACSSSLSNTILSSAISSLLLKILFLHSNESDPRKRITPDLQPSFISVSRSIVSHDPISVLLLSSIDNTAPRLGLNPSSISRRISSSESCQTPIN